MSAGMIAVQIGVAGGEFVPLSEVPAGGTPGSISSHEPDGRRVYLFGWLEGEPGVWESHGVDVDLADAVRLVAPAHLERLSTLAEPFELDTTSRHGVRCRLRFTATPTPPKGNTDA